jgi:hypothetical protein
MKLLARKTIIFCRGTACRALISQVSSGFILPIILIFLSVILLLITAELASSGLEWRMTAYQKTRLQLLNAGENCLQQASTQLAKKPACQISLLSADDLLNQPEHFWLSSRACQLKESSYRMQYVVESLGGDECAELSGHLGVDFWRITCRADMGFSDNAVIVEQATLAVAHDGSPPCYSTTRHLSSSWQTLRELKR